MFGSGATRCNECGDLVWIISLHKSSCKGRAMNERLAPFFSGIRDFLNRPTT